MDVGNGFKKLDNMHYEIKVTDEMFKLIDGMVVTLSRNKAEEFLDYHNQYLFDHMMARYVSAMFAETGEKIDNNFGLVVITIKMGEYSFKVSLGDVQVSPDKSFRIAGLLYDN